MIKKPEKKSQISMFFSLKDTLDQKHPLFILAEKINWLQFEEAFSPLYCPDNGRIALPIRLMVGLLILKHLRNISDESVVEQYSENVYYQYLCGQSEFVAKFPCEASELVHFRNRIGEEGVELILKESIRINGDDRFDPDVSIDTTVQEKNVTYPTDNKLHRKIIERCKSISEKEGHIAIDEDSEVIKIVEFTKASIHDSNQFEQLVDYSEQAVFADKGYANKTRRKKLEAKNIFDGILSKGYRNKPLSKAAIRFNQLLSVVRNKVERPFACMKRVLNYQRCSYYDLKRNRFEFIMAALVYNIGKLITATT